MREGEDGVLGFAGKPDGEPPARQRHQAGCRDQLLELPVALAVMIQDLAGVEPLSLQPLQDVREVLAAASSRPTPPAGKTAGSRLQLPPDLAEGGLCPVAELGDRQLDAESPEPRFIELRRQAEVVAAAGENFPAQEALVSGELSPQHGEGSVVAGEPVLLKQPGELRQQPRAVAEILQDSLSPGCEQAASIETRTDQGFGLFRQRKVTFFEPGVSPQAAQRGRPAVPPRPVAQPSQQAQDDRLGQVETGDRELGFEPALVELPAQAGDHRFEIETHRGVALASPVLTERPDRLVVGVELLPRPVGGQPSDLLIGAGDTERREDLRLEVGDPFQDRPGIAVAFAHPVGSADLAAVGMVEGLGVPGAGWA